MTSIDDHLRAQRLVIDVQGDVSDIRSLQLDWAPASKARPRFGKGGHTYTPAESRRAEKRTADFLRRQVLEPMTGNVVIACIFFRPDRQRIDADNMLKHVCDAANGILWLDDSQVTAIIGVVELDEEHPRTVIALAPHETTLTRGTDATRDCEHCGRPFNIIGLSKARRFCSSSCSHAARSTVLGRRTCKACEKDFQPQNKYNTVCSPECRTEWLRNRPRPSSGIPMSSCIECGKELAHRRGGRCRDCWRADPAFYANVEKAQAQGELL